MNFPLSTSGIALSNSGVFAANIANAWTLTAANFISGTGSVVKSGAGTLTLEAANSYSLGTTITGGVVALGSYDGGNENSGALGSGPVAISNNGEITFGGTSGGTVVTTTFSNNFSVNGGVFFGQDGYQNLTGTVTIGPGGLTAYTQWGGKDVALGQLAGSGPLVIDSTIAAGSTAGGAGGIVHVSGSAGYTGTVTVNPAGVTALAGTRATGLGGELEVDSAAALADASVVMNSTRGMVFSAANPVFGSLSGSGNIALGLTTGAIGTLTVGGNNATTTYSGVLSGTGALAKVWRRRAHADELQHHDRGSDDQRRHRGAGGQRRHRHLAEQHEHLCQQQRGTADQWGGLPGLQPGHQHLPHRWAGLGDVR